MRNIYLAIAGRLANEGPFALATIIDSGGSTPQVPGASALFSRRGLVLGTVGGGALEAEAERRARAALGGGRSVLFRFGLRGEGLEGEEPVCGGEAVILIDASPVSHRDAFLANAGFAAFPPPGRSGDTRPAGVRRARPGSGAAGRRRATEKHRPGTRLSLPGRGYRTVLRENRPVVLRPAAGAPVDGGFDFLEPLAPLPRLLIAGAGHIGQAVSRLAGPTRLRGDGDR